MNLNFLFLLRHYNFFKIRSSFYLDPVQGQDPRVVLDLTVEAEVVAKAEASHVLSLDLARNLSRNQDPVQIHHLNLVQTALRARSNLAAEVVVGA